MSVMLPPDVCWEMIERQTCVGPQLVSIRLLLTVVRAYKLYLLIWEVPFLHKPSARTRSSAAAFSWSVGLLLSAAPRILQCWRRERWSWHVRRPAGRVQPLKQVTGCGGGGGGTAVGGVHGATAGRSRRAISVQCSFQLQRMPKMPRQSPGARFTKYLTTILRVSYDNAKVTINLRRTSNLQNILQWMESFS